jgi:4,5-dihydroxyphthalate decarboxylase
VGTPGYSSTSLTWIRGILSDEYGVAPDEINWVYSQKDSSSAESGKASKQENTFPAGLNIRPGPVGVDESELLVSGEVDALFHAATPQAYLEGHPKVARLFPNSRAIELAYYKKTGIFPIMHSVAVRKSLLQDNPQLIAAIFQAYSEAKSRSYAYMNSIGWAADMLPWYGQELEYTKAEMGPNFYSYGIQSNRKSLETLFRYSYEQGLASRQLKIEELFHPASLALEEV